VPDAITHIDQCNDQWLSAVMGHEVTIAGIDSVGAGVGLLGELHRVTLAEGSDPASLIVKLGAEANADIAVHFGYYEREWGAYRDLLVDGRVAAPTCHLNALVDDRPCLVLEDLARHRSGDQVQGITEAEATAAVDLAADLHAGFWDDGRLEAFTWMPGPEDPRVAGYGNLLEMMWDQFRAGAGSGAGADVLGAARAAMDRFDDVIEEFSRAPVTVVHGDFRLDNLLFDGDGPAVAVDWQLTARGRGPYDLAFLLAGSAETEFRRRHERGLLERYHERLRHHGVDDYSFDACWQDYRRGHIQNLPNPVTAAVVVDPGNDRGREMLRRNAERALVAVADLWG